MKPCLVVLTDFSPAAARARAYAAALAAPLGAELHLVHVFFPPPVATEYGMLVPALDARYAQDTRRSLEQVAASLPVPATAELVATDLHEAVLQAIDTYHPLLLVAGLTTTHNQLDEWLSNRALPLARQTGYPLLLVPEHLPDTALRAPRRLALAVKDQVFALPAEATAVAPLFDTLGTDIVTVCVLKPEERAGGWQGHRAAQHCGLAAVMPRSGLHKVVSDAPGQALLHAARELSADLLGLLDPGHGWVHKLFNGSVIDYVLRHTHLPVLLLATR